MVKRVKNDKNLMVVSVSPRRVLQLFSDEFGLGPWTWTLVFAWSLNSARISLKHINTYVFSFYKVETVIDSSHTNTSHNQHNKGYRVYTKQSRQTTYTTPIAY